MGTAGVPGYRVQVACQYLSNANLSGTKLLSNIAVMTPDAVLQSYHKSSVAQLSTHVRL